MFIYAYMHTLKNQIGWYIYYAYLFRFLINIRRIFIISVLLSSVLCCGFIDLLIVIISIVFWLIEMINHIVNWLGFTCGGGKWENKWEDADKWFPTFISDAISLLEGPIRDP